MHKKINKQYWFIGLVALCFIGSVFAYWTQEILVHNEFQTARYDTTLEEKFESPINWCPGQETNKDVWIKNKGTIPVFAKIVIHQEWIRKENVKDIDGSFIPPLAGEKFPLSFDSKNGKEYAAQIGWGEKVMLLESGRKSDIDLRLPIAFSIEEAKDKWLLVSDQPDQNGNYTFYYIGQIASGSDSPLLVSSVTMNPQIQPSVLQKDTYYNENKKVWETTSQRNSTYGYDCAKYTMDVTASTVQATEDAVQEVFGTAEDNKEIVSYLASHAWNPMKF